MGNLDCCNTSNSDQSNSDYASYDILKSKPNDEYVLAYVKKKHLQTLFEPEYTESKQHHPYIVEKLMR